ncbi:hypothetical protein BDB00DRAFT_619236 [Zychaea mexicana]|uniref:uncharacterized protein n=1 Tax=Zychaea mexicana TaxID=64656 RepID=UPI0022FF122A|nr:uncharacterized protein BDB00DRAFT_619236 [Zychaea mexicana]KAI9489366.1 hypothetical protein BDB00DRAFT_619236 [Zychaea mexicana]
MQLTLEGLQSLLIDLTNFIHVILGIAVVLVILIAFRAFPFHHDYSEIFSAVRYLGLQHLLAYAYSTTCILLRLPVSLVSVGSRRSSTTTMTNKQYAAYQQQTAAALDSIYHASNSELDSICLRDPITTSSSNGSNNYHSYYYVSGLVNTGNTCFLNSVLQVLSSLPRLQLYLEQIQPSRARPVSWFLATTLRRLNQPLLKRSSFKPVDIVSVVSGRRINSRDQQDAQELFQLITSAIDVEEEKLQSSMAASVMGGLKDILAPSSLSYKIHHRLKNPFTGLLASRLSCMQCGYTVGVFL